MVRNDHWKIFEKAKGEVCTQINKAKSRKISMQTDQEVW